jgi:copper-binding protein NosD
MSRSDSHGGWLQLSNFLACPHLTLLMVDNALVDLSNATVDCSGQTGPDPRIGVWIQSRSQVRIKGGGTGLVRNCGVGVLIGPADPGGADPGGSANHVDGLIIQHPACPTGPIVLPDLPCVVGLALWNGRDNVIDHVAISTAGAAIEIGILVYGTDPRASASGGNKIFGNTLEGGFNSYGILVSSNGNTVRDNSSTGPIEGVAITQDSNIISSNHISFFEGADQVFAGIHLLPGADDNTITRNDIRAADYGLLADLGTLRNLIRGNTAVAVSGLDAVDRSGACVNNTWTRNTFTTADPVCILGLTN